MAPIVVVHDSRIGDNACRREGREELANVQGRLAEEIPLLTFAIEAVNVENGWLAKETRNPGDRTVGDVADEDDIRGSERDVNKREERVKGRVKVLP